jgi:pimeloyl-ACP methyl ester carboxylesterase
VLTRDGHPVPYVIETAPGGGAADVILCHGLLADRDEYNGLHVRMSAALRAAGLNAIRFDFRGHGASDLPAQDMTIAGELLDLTAVLELARVTRRRPQYLVATSFGAVSSILRLRGGDTGVRGLVLWNPVVNVRATFVEPGTGWSRSAISPGSIRLLDAGERTHVNLSGFRMGRRLVDELRTLDLTEDLRGLTLPILAAHGTGDDRVPFRYTAAALAGRPNARLVELPGAGHGFVDFQAEVIADSVTFLAGLVAEAGVAGGSVGP